MKVKDLKKIIEKLPEEMDIASLDRQGSYESAIAYVDGNGDEDEYPMEWLVIAVRDELED
ncbi:hypothetical protein [Carnobacterium pleistocenium]|uniref:hypothetical protein n=1 Tax=Carnobacterium pleistocenium TaxID=181073 RepID=UPI00054CD8B9|nr:hypothetical protein [Carnobacterium pleistocenium]